MESSTLRGMSPSIRIPKDIVVQEFVEGSDFSVVIVEVGDRPVPLSPERYIYPTNLDLPSSKTFLTYDVKFHPDTHLELVERKDKEHLFDKLQNAAVEALRVNKMQACSWGNVDIRISPSGEPVAIEVNPMPAVFLPKAHQWEDLAIEGCFPGGHRAFINILIASHQIRQPPASKNLERVGGTYDWFSPRYDDVINSSELGQLIVMMVSKHNYDGSILGLGSGTGLFGRSVASKNAIPTPPPDEAENRGSSTSDGSISQPNELTITGIELSAGMIGICESLGVYKEIHQGSIQSTLPSLENFGHIVCFSMIHFLPSVELSMVLVAAFRLARKSITLSVDEIPEEYNVRLRGMGPSYSYMVGGNRVKEVEAFGVPTGWKLADRFRVFACTSPHTKDDIYTSVFNFERESMVVS